MITLTFFLANALRPVRRDFPDDCTIIIGRAATGPDFVVLGDAPNFEVRARSAHLSDDHAVIVCRAGSVTLVDRHSRNGTFVRLDPARPHPLDARPVRLGHDLVIVRDDPSRPLPEYLGHLTPEAFAAWVRAHLGDHLSVELTTAPNASCLALVGPPLHLLVRPVGEARTLDADASWWLRAVVNTWNASARPLVDARPWRFEARSTSRRRALDLARRVAAAALPVLLVGPAGAGRTVLAQDLHDHGAAPDSPFVTARCATLTPASLARHFDLAGDGTLFLDEVTDLSPATQSELLSRLSSEPDGHASAAARILAATTADLASAAWSERLDHDLRDHLALIVLEVTPDSANTPAADPGPAPTASVKNIAPPATLGRLFADMVFLLAARDAGGCAPLSRRVHMTYQGADARLGALDVTVGDRAGCDARIAVLQRDLRAHIAGAPAVVEALRGVLDE